MEQWYQLFLLVIDRVISMTVKVLHRANANKIRKLTVFFSWDGLS